MVDRQEIDKPMYWVVVEVEVEVEAEAEAEAARVRRRKENAFILGIFTSSFSAFSLPMCDRSLAKPLCR